jgi:hypothetical protein
MQVYFCTHLYVAGTVEHVLIMGGVLISGVSFIRGINSTVFLYSLHVFMHIYTPAFNLVCMVISFMPLTEHDEVLPYQNIVSNLPYYRQLQLH